MAGLKVEKKEKENSRQVAGRFIRSLRKSGLLFRAKKAQFRERPKSDKLKKRAALRKLEIQKEYKKLEKLGKV